MIMITIRKKKVWRKVIMGLHFRERERCCELITQMMSGNDLRRGALCECVCECECECVRVWGREWGVALACEGPAQVSFLALKRCRARMCLADRELDGQINVKWLGLWRCNEHATSVRPTHSQRTNYNSLSTWADTTLEEKQPLFFSFSFLIRIITRVLFNHTTNL